MAKQYTTANSASMADKDNSSMPDPTRATSHNSSLSRWIPILVAAIVLTMMVGLGIQSRNTARQNPAATNQNDARNQTDSSSAARSNGPFPQAR